MLNLFTWCDMDFSLYPQIKVIDWQEGASLRILFVPLIIAAINFIQTTEQKSFMSQICFNCHCYHS